MLDVKTPQQSKSRTLRRLALLALLPAALTACMPPEDTQAEQEPAITEPAPTPETTAPPEAATSPAEENHDMEGHDAEGHDMEDHDMGEHDSADMAESTGTLPLEIEAATVTAVPASMPDTAAHLTLRNTADSDVVLVAASSPVAAHAMLMNTVSSESGGASMSGMVQTPSLTVPAGGELVMAPAGDHVMLMGLHEPLEEGQTVPIALQADDGRTLEVEAVVQKP